MTCDFFCPVPKSRAWSCFSMVK